MSLSPAQSPPSNSAGTPKMGQKKQIKRACDFCRFAKVQCTLSDADACNRCVSYRVPCTFVQSAPPPRRWPGGGAKHNSSSSKQKQKQHDTAKTRPSQRRDGIVQKPTRNSRQMQTQTQACKDVQDLLPDKAIPGSGNWTDLGNTPYILDDLCNELQLQIPHSPVSHQSQSWVQQSAMSSSLLQASHVVANLNFDATIPPLMDFASPSPSSYDLTLSADADMIERGGGCIAFDPQWIYPFFPETETETETTQHILSSSSSSSAAADASPPQQLCGGWPNFLPCIDSGYTSDASPTTTTATATDLPQSLFSPGGSNTTTAAVKAVSTPIDDMSLEELLLLDRPTALRIISRTK